MTVRATKIRVLKRKNLPKGKFNYIVDFKLRDRPAGFRSAKHMTPPMPEQADIITLLESTARGKWGAVFDKNSKGFSRLTTLYFMLEHDLMLLKLCYPALVWKIFKIELAQ